ncbi:MAG: serine/threonine protein kinase [Actinomycetales bacterium]|nr:MAG: serine/threonine protein kinase [Actinomycetales bacterium]
MSRSGLAPPELDGFRYVDRIGGGGFADVYRYDQTLPERQVAVKVLHRGIGGPAVDSFRSEANLMAKLSNHPSIVTIYQAGVSADHRPFLVMEMCSSAHLGSRIAKRTLTIQETLELGIQIAGAVETAHRQNILHRDIKPANILFTEFKRPALTDFGISVSVDTSDGSTGRALSPPWAPPEQFGNSPHPMGPWSDVYSLAATLYAMLVGHSPMELPQGPNDALSIGARVRNTPAPPTQRPDVPTSLERALSVALSKNPQQRYSSALDFARALQGIQAEQHLSVTTVDVRTDDIEDDIDDVDTGTRVGGFVLIDPDDDQRGQTETSHTARTSEDTEFAFRSARSMSMTGDHRPAPQVLQHGRGVAPAVEPLDFTGPPPAEVDHGYTYAPTEHEIIESEPDGPRWWLWIAGVVSVVVIAGLGVVALRGVANEVGDDPSGSTAQSVAPADPLTGLVPKVQDLAGTRQGDEVTFTWVNPEPRDGDTYSYWVQEVGVDRAEEVTDQTVVTVPAVLPKTCIEVELRRSNGRGSAPERSCVE